MTGLGWIVLFLAALIIAAIAGSGLARRMLGVLACLVGLAVFVLWLFAPVAPA